ncbi:MAG: FAD-binding protein [Thermodesulfobacteriota bacterium]
MPSVWIDYDLCDGCARCLKKCPYGAIELREGFPHILEQCTCCGLCLEACRQGALQTDIQPRTIPDFSSWEGVWVFAEQQEGRLAEVGLELLGKARELGEQRSEEVCALLLGNGVEDLAETLFCYGADRVYLVQDPLLKTYSSEGYAAVLAGLVGRYQPEILLLGATDLGRDLAPRLARRIGAGLTADCTGLRIDAEEGILLQTRPAFGGNIMATIANRFSRPQMATVRPGVMEKKSGFPAKGILCREEAGISGQEIRVRLLETWTAERELIDLSKARVIVAAGRGAASKEGLALLEKLARTLDGELAGTRAMIEEQWLPPDRQIGQTGQTVRPELYIGCGVSGAIQHRAGMSGSRYVIAVNRDSRAPILQVADWGLVGDLFQIVPELISSLSRRT